MDPQLLITKNGVVRENKIGSIVEEVNKNLFDVYEELSQIAHFDTGLLPLDGSGTLSIRQAGDRTQFVFQHVPGIYYMIWGAYEGSKDADQVHLAQPYRIVIGDHVDGTLRGARHFYSPVPITSITQPLYHCNVPNLNCKGYRGNGVGWICIYHSDSTYTQDIPLGAKMHKTIEHASGHEAYNDGNMGSTDGPRFYREHYNENPEYAYLWDKKKWQTKTNEEGFEWTLNPDLWVPIRVQDIDNQDKHVPDGQILTLEMAMLGNYAAYYPSPSNREKELSLMNVIRRQDKDNPDDTTMFQLYSHAFKKAKTAEQVAKEKSKLPSKPKGLKGNLLVEPEQKDKVWKPEVSPFAAAIEAEENKEIGYCGYCSDPIKQKDVVFKDSTGQNICQSCKDLHFKTTLCCNVLAHAGDLFIWHNEAEEELFYCHSCHSLSVCTTCSAQYLDEEYMLYDEVCIGCSPEPSYCENCGGKHSESNVHKVIAMSPSEDLGLVNKTFTLCHDCFSQSVICKCGLLKNEDTTNTLPIGGIVCGPCVQFPFSDSVPIYTPVHIKQEV